MAEVVAAFCVSHAAIMVRRWEQAPEATRARVRAGYDEVARRLRAARPDVLLMVGNDHYQSFFVDQMPAFCLGVSGPSQGWGDADLPRYRLEVHEPLARGLLARLMAAGFDLAYALRLPLDHAFIVPAHLVFPECDLPVVPLFQNTVAPPLVPTARCFALGRALRAALEAVEPGLRVALMATGGLSHEVPLPDWRSLGDDEADRAWLEFMASGRHGADPAVQKRIADEVVRWGQQGLGRIYPEFDREALAWLAAGEYERLAEMDDDTLRRRAGNGGLELRNWVTVLGAMPATRAEVLFYEPVPQWLTGIGGVALA